MTRILLITGDVLRRDETLRRRVLRFTGSRRATRVILGRIATARHAGEVMSCLVLPRPDGSEDESRWDVQVSFTSPPMAGGLHA